MNKKIIHDALVLTAFTVILGFILGLVHEITKEPIAAAEAATKQVAYQTVFSDASSFEEVEDVDYDAANALLSENGYSDTISEVLTACDASGEALGYVITVTANDGSQASITMSVGIRADGTVNGYSITDISETPGLGMKVEEEDFYSQFEGKQVDAFSVVKTEPAADNEIEAITGATISSKAVANAVNAALVYCQNSLGGAQ